MTSPLRTLLMSLGAVIMAVAHAAGPSFDCTKAKAWSEIRVCENITLAALDQKVARLFGDAKTRLTNQAQQQLIAEQKAWLRERESCKQQSDPTTCLLGVYEKRILQLRSGTQSKLVGEPVITPQVTSSGWAARFPSRSFSPKAVWDPPSDLPLKIANDECPSQQTNCITAKMRAAGASDDAIRFVELSNGEEYLSEFRELGRVDLAALSMFSYNSPELAHWEILVNGQPPAFEPVEGNNNINIHRHPLYPKLARKFPHAELFTLYSFEAIQALPNGGQRFVFEFTLLNGCRACEPAGSAKIGYDFDIHGEYQGAVLLELKPVDR